MHLEAVIKIGIGGIHGLYGLSAYICRPRPTELQGAEGGGLGEGPWEAEGGPGGALFVALRKHCYGGHCS